jgi:hypothetical protein
MGASPKRAKDWKRRDEEEYIDLRGYRIGPRMGLPSAKYPQKTPRIHSKSLWTCRLPDLIEMHLHISL